MAQLKIRPFEMSDANAVRQLYAESVALNKKGFIQDLSYHGDIAAFGIDMQNSGGDFIVVDYRDTIVGMGALRPEAVDGHIEMCKLHLKDTYQGIGIGKQMANYLLLRAGQLGYHTCTLHVTTSQEAAIGLYKHLGFEEDKVEVWEGDINGKLEAYETLFMHKNIS